MSLYCYHIPPIDSWLGALTRRQLIEALWEEGQGWEAVAAACRRVAALEEEAERGFKRIAWEGDVREGPYYFALPRDPEMSLGYIIKQDNNGNCFVASPVALPHLESAAFETTVTS